MGAVNTICCNEESLVLPKSSDDTCELSSLPEAQPYYALSPAQPLDATPREDGLSDTSEPEQEPISFISNDLEKIPNKSHGHFLAANGNADKLATRPRIGTDTTLDSETCVETHHVPTCGYPSGPSPPRSRSKDKPVTSFDIDFVDVDGAIKTITVSKRPLGIIFSTTPPIRVNGLKQGSHGEELGVQRGWEVKTIAGEDMTILSAEEILAAVRRNVGLLPDYTDLVELVFIANGEEINMTVSRRPLGITLGETEPLAIGEVVGDSYAESLGLQAGWTIKAVAKQDLTNMEYYRAIDVFEFGIKASQSSENFTSFRKRMACGPEEEQIGLF